MAINAPIAPVGRQRAWKAVIGAAVPAAAGAKWHTWAAGTQLDLETYSDSALTTPNANPVVADANGLFGPVYLQFGKAYRFQINESNDSTLIWDQDNIIAGDPAQTTTTTLTGQQNNLQVTQGTSFLRCNNATELDITGIAATGPALPLDGQLLCVVSIGAGNVKLRYNSTASLASYRLLNLTTSADTYLAAGKGVAVYQYDLATLSWRMITHDQGDWITPTFASGGFTAQAGNWTVAAGDVTNQAFYLKGRQLLFTTTLVTTTTSSTPTSLRQQIPGGYTASSSIGAQDYLGIGNPAGTYAAIRVQALANLLYYFPTIAGTGNWTAVTDTLAVNVSGSLIAL